MTIAYIGLGSNLNNPATQINLAINALDEFPQSTVLQCSSLYGNPPMGPPGQPDFVNAVIALDTKLAADALLVEMKNQERTQGRTPFGERWGPRIIDLDLLLYGDESLQNADLVVPHMGIADRAFVLVPLAEIAPDIEVPGLGPIEQLLERIDKTSIIALPTPNQGRDVLQPRTEGQ